MQSLKSNMVSKVTKQQSFNSSKQESLKKKRSVSPEVQEKGKAALAEWRAARAKAKALGPAAFQGWEWQEERKKALKKTTPMMAIKAFCNECLSGCRKDIKNCTAKQCSLYIYRPYQDDNDETL